MKVALIRGSYFNKFEMQNYEPLSKKIELVGFSGLNPIHEKFSFPLVKLPSPVDLPSFPKKMALLNRIFLGDAMYLFGLEKQLKGFDIAHVRETYFHFTLQALKAREKGLVKKVVCTCSETIPFNHEGIWGRKKLKQKAIKEVDLFHCLTQKAEQCLVKEGCDPEKIMVFPYGIDTDLFKPVVKRNSKVLNLLFIGRFVKEKGIYDLLKAFIKLRENYRVKLTMIGKGPEKENIVSLIKQAELESLITIKSVDYKDINQEYRKADIFVLLSRPTKHWEEYFGMVLLEAMSSGLPIVATKTGGVPEVIGKDGLLIKPNKWQEALQALQALCKDKDLRQKLGKKARNRAINLFDKNKVALNIKKFYQQAYAQN